MSGVRQILAIGRADFLERVRRYSFLLTLIFAAYLAYAAATGKIVMLISEHRGVYTAGWIGLMIAMVTTCFVPLVGFYIVKNSVERDRATRVGQILAASPLSKSGYFLGKLLSNFAVLASIVFLLGLGAIAMFFLAAEDRHFDAWALLSPLLLIALPAVAFTAALSLLFEATPLLRGGSGNVVWFFLWTFILAYPGASKNVLIDPFGLVSAMDYVKPLARQVIPDYTDGTSLTIGSRQIVVAPGLRFPGVDWTLEAVLLRIAWVFAGIAVALLAAALFNRFDENPGQFSRLLKRAAKQKNKLGTQVTAELATRNHAELVLTPLTRTQKSPAFLRMVVAELRLALQGFSWWWYAVAAGLLVGQLFSPLVTARGVLLAISWLWPIFVWSAMGARETRFGMRQLMFSCPEIIPRQLLASWLAGVAVALASGAGALARLFIAGDFGGAAAVLVAALFIPALALALGIATGSGKFFEALYTVLWYIGPMNHTAGFDFTGASNAAGLSQVSFWYVIFVLALLLGAVTFRFRQLRTI